MCGIVGLVQKDDCFTELYDSLIMLQHRGQDAAGMTVCKKGNLHSRKSKGLVSEVFNQQHFERLRGTYGIGHVRYPTAGGSGAKPGQPAKAEREQAVVDTDPADWGRGCRRIGC